MSWRSRGKQSRNGDTRSYRQEDAYSDNGRSMNMNNDKSSEMLIANTFVGKVIGKGGSKIKELQDKSKACIKVLKNNSGAANTSIWLSGTSEAIKKAKGLIEDLISGVSNLSEGDYSRTAGRPMNMNNEKSSEIFIDNSLVGKVIGKEGYKIRELQDESNAYINVLKNYTSAADICIRLTGTSEAIEKAKSLIEDLISGVSNLSEGDSSRTAGRPMNMNNEKSSEIFIDNSLVGKVIGKEGYKIRELQDESNAYINVLKNYTSAADTCIKLTGTSEAIEKAKSLIEELIYDASNSSQADSYPNSRRMDMNNEMSSEIFIENSLVGKVIGKEGYKIRELQDESNAYINVLKNYSNAAETTVVLSGTSEAIERAKSLIEDLIYGVQNLSVENKPICNTSTNYILRSENEPFDGARSLEKSEDATLMNMDNETSSEIFIDNSFVGKVIGKGGSKIRELQDESQAYIKVLKNYTSAADTCIRLTGTSEAIEKAKSLIEELIYDVSNSSQADSYPTSRRMNMDNEMSSEIFIDNSFVGIVIGKGGSKIRELEDESNAYIKVLKNDSSATETSIMISGTSEAIERAKSLIEDLISRFSNLATQNNQIKLSKNYTQPPDDEHCDWAELLEQNEEVRFKKLASIPPVIKNFYKEDPEVASMRPEDVMKFRKDNNCISVMKFDPYDNREIPNPVTSFKHAFHDYPQLLEELRKQEFSAPSPIQSQAWPILLLGYDMIGIAQTGTGKTIAFLLPALVHIIGQVTPREKRVGPSALILAPTRELAQQIEAEAKKYQHKGISSICICGGRNRRNQINVIAKGVDLIIATPGRLNDLCTNRLVHLFGVTYLVIDEADRMLDMGFEPQIRNIINEIREDRQTVMTSATWTEVIQELATRFMTKPFKVNVGAYDLAAVHSVTQEILFCEDDFDERRKILDEFIKSMLPDDKAIVFVATKAIADDIASDLNLRGIAVQSIHGDKEQYERKQALDDLRNGHVKILIATDVASRGIDIKDVTIVFNLFFPRNIEEYVHRVGRTGRAGRTGKAISVVTKSNMSHAADLIKILKEADQYVPDELYDMAARYKTRKDRKMLEDRSSGGRRSGRDERNRY